MCVIVAGRPPLSEIRAPPDVGALDVRSAVRRVGLPDACQQCDTSPDVTRFGWVRRPGCATACCSGPAADQNLPRWLVATVSRTKMDRSPPSAGRGADTQESGCARIRSARPDSAGIYSEVRRTCAGPSRPSRDALLQFGSVWHADAPNSPRASTRAASSAFSLQHSFRRLAASDR